MAESSLVGPGIAKLDADLTKLRACLDGDDEELGQPLIPAGFVAEIECGPAVWGAVTLLRNRWVDLPVFITSRRPTRSLSTVATANRCDFSERFDDRERERFAKRSLMRRAAERSRTAHIATIEGLKRREHDAALALAYGAVRSFVPTVLQVKPKTVDSYLTEVYAKCRIEGCGELRYLLRPRLASPVRVSARR